MGNMVTFAVSHKNINTLDPQECANSLLSGGPMMGEPKYYDHNGLVVSHVIHNSSGAVMIFNAHGYIYTKAHHHDYKTPVDLTHVLKSMTNKRTLTTKVEDNMSGDNFSVFGFLTDEYHEIDFVELFTFIRDNHDSIKMPETYTNNHYYSVTCFPPFTDGFSKKVACLGTFTPDQMSVLAMEGNVFNTFVAPNKMTPADIPVTQTDVNFLLRCVGR